MPKIQQYAATESLDATPLVYAGQAAAATGRARARMYEGFGRTAQGLIQQAEDHVQRQETLKLTAEMAKKQAELAIEWEKTKASGDPNDPELASRFLEERVKPTFDGMSNNLWTKGAQDFAAQHSAKIQADFFSRTTVDQMELAKKATLENLAELTRANGVTAFHNPSGMEQILEQQKTAVDVMGEQNGLTATQRQDLNSKMANEVAMNAAMSDADKRPKQLLADIKRGRYDLYLTGEQLNRLRDSAESKIQADQDLSLGPRRFALQNDMIRVQNGFAPKHNWTDGEVAGLAGRNRKGEVNQEQALRMVQGWQEANAIGRELQAAQGLPFADRAARLERLRQEIGSAPDAKVAESRLEAATQAYKRAVASYTADPAAFTLEENEPVAKALAQYQQSGTPQDFQAYLALQSAAQTRYNPGAPPDLLTDPMRQGLAEPLAALSTAADAQKAVQTLKSLRDTSGPYFGMVVKNLGKAVQPQHRVAASLMAANKDADARLVLQSSTKEAKSFIDANTTAAGRALAETRASRALADMAATMPDQLDQVNAMREAVVNVTLWQKAHGADVSADDVAKKMITGDYKFWQNVRIPKTMDRGAVRRELNSALDTLEPVVPGNTAPPAAYRAALKRQGTWVSTPSGEGAMLMDNTTGYPVYETVNGQPQPVIRYFGQKGAPK